MLPSCAGVGDVGVEDDGDGEDVVEEGHREDRQVRQVCQDRNHSG